MHLWCPPPPAEETPPRERPSRSSLPHVSAGPLRWKSDSAGTYQLLLASNLGFQPFIKKVRSLKVLCVKSLLPALEDSLIWPKRTIKLSFRRLAHVPLCVFRAANGSFTLDLAYLCDPFCCLRSAGSGLFTQENSPPLYRFIYTPPTHASICSHITHGPFQL